MYQQGQPPPAMRGPSPRPPPYLQAPQQQARSLSPMVPNDFYRGPSPAPQYLHLNQQQAPFPPQQPHGQQQAPFPQQLPPYQQQQAMQPQPMQQQPMQPPHLAYPQRGPSPRPPFPHQSPVHRGPSPAPPHPHQQQQQQPSPQPNNLSPHMPRAASPAQMHRKTRRHYPGAPMPAVSTPPPAPFDAQANGSHPQGAAMTTPLPHQPVNNDIQNGMANMHIGREEVPLVGQLPRIADVDLPYTPPPVAANLTAISGANPQCPAQFQRSTLNTVPATNALLKKTKLPFALILEPYLDEAKGTVPVVEDTIVSRCTRCKTYINPFVHFTQGALKWQCNMCGLENDAPSGFDWDVIKQQQADRWQRAELNHGCVDFVASAEYMMRPPQPPVYVFVLDTSLHAVQSGVIGLAADAILQALDHIPNEDGRTKVAFLTADSAVAFYKLTGDEPEILVVGDLADIYLPRAATDLVVNLSECRPLLQDMLARMKDMFTPNTAPGTNCLGTALQAARKLLAPTGGKIVCFQVSLPNVGEGQVKPAPNDQKAVLDAALMTPSTAFYKTFAAECTKVQVCADMFLFGAPYADVATLNVLPRFTGGQTHYYPHFSAADASDRRQLQQEVRRLLAEKIGLEAVMRTRCSPGLICKSFYGNCTTRVPDIMALPNVPRDQSYCIEVGIEEDIATPVVYFQTALLYTTCFGERRIRVLNVALPVTKSLPDVFAAVDQVAVARTLCHQAIDKAATSKLKDGRDLLWRSTADICHSYSKEVGGSAGTSQLTVGRTLSILPLLVLSLLKSETFSEHATIPIDSRSQTTVLLRTLPLSSWIDFVCPRFYALHAMPPQAGTVDPQTNQVIMPPRMNLTSEKLEQHGCYLIENGQRMYVWLGKAAVPPLCKDLFNVPDISHIKSGKVVSLPTVASDISQRVSAVIQHLQEQRQDAYYPALYVMREDDDPVLRSSALALLVEDRHPSGPTNAGANQQDMNSGMSYYQWLGFLRSKNGK